MKVRVLVNAIHARSGGGITYLNSILPLLADDTRLEIHLFLQAAQFGLLHPVDERIRVHLFRSRGFLSLIAWEQLALPVLARVMSADVVFSPANFGSLLIRRQVILLRNAVAVARTETRLSKRVYWAALGLVTLLSILISRRSIGVSHYALKALSMRLHRLMPHRMAVVHHGVSPLFRPDPAIVRERFLLAVSDIYVQKNLTTLLRAMRLVCNRHPDMRLVIAGSVVDAWYHGRCTELVRELELDRNVHFVGRVGGVELKRLYQTCLAFVFPSTAETFGLPLVESMACGAPVASSNTTAMPEIVGDAALLFDPLDCEAMAAALLQLTDEPDLRAKLSAKAVLRAAEFSCKRTAERTVEVLLDAAGAAGADRR